jgi:glycosyltransferase involved in cell wall biosynthesis
VAIPTYNRQEMIRGTLESALAQELDGLEILVIDDQSTDRVLEIAASYDDPRLRVIRNERNLGLFGNFNRCVELSRGALVRILCNDDRLTKGSIKREVELMEANPGVALLFSRGERVSGTGIRLGVVGDHFQQGIYNGRNGAHAILWFYAHYGINPVTLPSGVLMRRSACLEAGRFDESMRMNGDIDYFLRLLEHGDLAVLDAVACEISIHERQMSSILEGEVALVEENFTLAERHADLLHNGASGERIIRQFAALAFLFSLRLRRQGRLQEARAHRQLARRFCPSHIHLYEAAARCLGLRAGLKYFGFRSIHGVARVSA